MTDTELTRPPEWASWTRRTWVTIWVSVALVVLLVAGLCVRARLNALDGRYGPVLPGSTGGIGLAPNVRTDPDGSSKAQLVTTGNHTTRIFDSMRNDGSHSVRVTGIEYDDITVGAQWAPYPEDDTLVPAANAHWRNFPGTIGAGEEVMLRYTIRRPPHCQDKPMDPSVGQVYDDRHVVHWESLLGNRTSTISSNFFRDRIQVC